MRAHEAGVPLRRYESCNRASFCNPPASTARRSDRHTGARLLIGTYAGTDGTEAGFVDDPHGKAARDMFSFLRHAPTALLLISSISPVTGVAAQQMEDRLQELGDPARLVGAPPLAVRTVVNWDRVLTETAGGPTEGQFQEAVSKAFEESLRDFGVPIDPDSENFLLCRVETMYGNGVVAFTGRVELHEPFGAEGETAVSWQQPQIGALPVDEMQVLFRVGERCAEDFAEAWIAARSG